MFWPSLESDPTRRALTLREGPTLSRHTPVMTEETVQLLACRPGAHFVDLTVGGGGHSEAILRATAPSGQVIGADRDSEALRRAGERLRPFGQRIKLLYGSLGHVGETLAQSGVERIDGALIDCGVSSDQLDESRRGFSFSRSGPLDMRMDPTSGVSAAEWLRTATPMEIERVLSEYGEERFSRRIARALVAARRIRKIETTTELAELVRASIPRSAWPRSVDPATRTFQAVRMRVNDELSQLGAGLKALLVALPDGSRLAVIAFHSLEDRLVKQEFRAAAQAGVGIIITRKPVRPSEAETVRNPRARSARLRVFEIRREQA